VAAHTPPRARIANAAGQGYRQSRVNLPAAGSAMLDDADVGAPGARCRADGFAFEDADLARLASQGRICIQRDIGVVAGAVKSVAVGRAGFLFAMTCRPGT
jgi:hypothetical protein